MSVGTLVRKFDDFLNPVVVKELRQAVTSRLVVTVLLLLLVVQTAVLGVFLVNEGANSYESSFSDGQDVFQGVQAIMVIACALLLPIFAWGKLSAERSDTNVDLLFITTLKPHSIVSGKIIANMLLGTMMFSACAPFMAFSYLMRGVGFPSIVLILAMDLLAVLGAIQIGLFFASIPGPRMGKFLMGFLGLFPVGMIVGWTISFAGDILRYGAFFYESRQVMWLLASAVGLFLITVGLFYFWSVALLSAPSANRAKPVRIYVLIVWVLCGGLGIGWSASFEDFEPLIIWIGITIGLGSLQFFISICEREKWGPRVTKTIPRSLLPRMIAFLFYSGFAGGFLFGALLMGATEAIGVALTERYDHWRNLEDCRAFLRVHLWLLFAYGYCYVLTASLIRKNLLQGSSLKREQTWILAIIVAIFVAVLPMLMAYVTGDLDSRYRRGSDTRWWNVGWPPYVIDEAERMQNFARYSGTHGVGYRYSYSLPDEGLVTLSYAFTGCWMAVVTLLSLPGFIKQFQRFRRHESLREDPREALPSEELALPLAAEVMPEGIQTAQTDANTPEGIQTGPDDE